MREHFIGWLGLGVALLSYHAASGCVCHGPAITFVVLGFFASSIPLGPLAHILFFSRFGPVRVFYPVVSLRLFYPSLGLSLCPSLTQVSVYLGGDPSI